MTFSFYIYCWYKYIFTTGGWIKTHSSLNKLIFKTNMNHEHSKRIVGVNMQPCFISVWIYWLSTDSSGFYHFYGGTLEIFTRKLTIFDGKYHKIKCDWLTISIRDHQLIANKGALMTFLLDVVSLLGKLLLPPQQLIGEGWMETAAFVSYNWFFWQPSRRNGSMYQTRVLTKWYH